MHCSQRSLSALLKQVKYRPSLSVLTSPAHRLIMSGCMNAIARGILICKSDAHFHLKYLEITLMAISYIKKGKSAQDKAQADAQTRETVQKILTDVQERKD